MHGMQGSNTLGMILIVDFGPGGAYTYGLLLLLLLCVHGYVPQTGT